MKCGHPTLERRKLGCVTRAGLILIPCLLFVLVLQGVWNDLKTREGRQKVEAETVAFLRTEDTYFVGIIVVMNIWLYAVLTRRLYPTSASVWRGLRHVGSLTIGGNDDFGSNGGDIGVELEHFFLIVILPFLFFKLGVLEYRLMKQLVHDPTGRPQTEQMQDAEPSRENKSPDEPLTN